MGELRGMVVREGGCFSICGKKPEGCRDQFEMKERKNRNKGRREL